MIAIAAREVGVLVGWNLGSWAMWTRLQSPRALEPEWSRSLGTGLRAAPRCSVAWSGEGAPVAIHGDIDGVRVTRGPDEHGRGALRTHVAGGDPWTYDASGDSLVLAVRDGDGVRLSRLMGDAVETVEKLTSTRRDVVAMGLHRMDRGYVLVLGLERALEVLRLDADLRVQSRVRHSLRRGLAAFASAAVTGTLAVALQYTGEAGVNAALIGRDGAMRERPHPVLTEDVRDITVHWDEHGFRVCGRAADGALRSRRIDRAYASQTLAEGIEAPFALTHVYGKTLVATAEASQLTLRVREADGLVRPARIDATPDDSERMRRTEAARAIGARWERLRTRGGYRGDGSALRFDPVSLECVVPARRVEERSLRVRFAVEGPPRMTFVLGEPGQPAPRASWTKMVGWLRRRLSPVERARADDARITMGAIIGDVLPPGARLETLGDAILLELPIAELPSPETLDGWARELL